MTCKVHTNAANPKAGQVPADVLKFVTQKKARPSESYQEVFREEHAVAFAVARATEISVVESMQAAVKQALAEGLPFKQFAQQITPSLQDAGWWGKREDGVQLGSPHRLKIIYDTNIRTARAAGQWKRIQEAKKALPYLRYRHGNPVRPRPDHESWDGRVLPVDHEFWTYAYPPNGYLCTCWVEQVSATQANKLGITPDEDVDLEPIKFENPRTGKVTTTIRGVDPTFAYNPGQARMEGLRQAGVVKGKAAKPKASASDEAARQARIAERARLLEQARKAEEARLLEQARKAEEAREARELAKAQRQRFAPALEAVDIHFDRGEYGQVRAKLATVLKDMGLKPRARGNEKSHEIQIGPSLGAAHMGWDGAMTITPEHLERRTADRVTFMSTLVHEEVHRHGSITPENYRAHPMIEEVSTEIVARKILREALYAEDKDAPHTLRPTIAGPYGYAIQDVVITLRNAGVENPAQVAENASVRYKSQNGAFDTPTAMWVSYLDVPTETKAVVLEKLNAVNEEFKNAN